MRFRFMKLNAANHTKIMFAWIGEFVLFEIFHNVESNENEGVITVQIWGCFWWLFVFVDF